MNNVPDVFRSVLDSFCHPGDNMVYDATRYDTYQLRPHSLPMLGKAYIIVGPAGYRRVIGGPGARARAESLVGELNQRLRRMHDKDA